MAYQEDIIYIKKTIVQKNSTIFFNYAYLKVGSDTMAYKEIVTKTVVGKSKKTYYSKRDIE